MSGRVNGASLEIVQKQRMKAGMRKNTDRYGVVLGVQPDEKRNGQQRNDKKGGWADAMLQPVGAHHAEQEGRNAIEEEIVVVVNKMAFLY